MPVETISTDEIKSLHFPLLECKAGEDTDDGPTFEGLLSTWDLDLGGDIVEPGAFKRTLRHWRSKAGRIVPLIDMHDKHSTVTTVVGKLEDAEERPGGLWTRWAMVPDDERSSAVHRRLSGGFVDGMSIGFRPVKVNVPTPAEQQAGVRRRLKEVVLNEGSVVIFPMNLDTRVDQGSVKALLERADELGEIDPARMSDDDKAELEQLHGQIGALLRAVDTKSDDPEGLAPDDPRRAAMEAAVREIQARGLTTHRLR